jgi:hypothetical protein
MPDQTTPKDAAIPPDGCAKVGDHFPDWYVILGPAPEGDVAGLPRPATGEFVEVWQPGDADGPRTFLGLLWADADGGRVIGWTDGYIVGCEEEGRATWLPRGWRSYVVPAGLSWPHLERWFRHADNHIMTYRRGRRYPDGPLAAEDFRFLVADAHLIIRHLALPGSPPEPRVAMDDAGCVAELRDLERFLKGAMSPEIGPPAEGAAGRSRGRKGRGGGKGKDIAGQMMAKLVKDPFGCTGWTVRRWAGFLRCSPSMVVETPAWGLIKEGRDKDKLELARSERESAPAEKAAARED